MNKGAKSSDGAGICNEENDNLQSDLDPLWPLKSVKKMKLEPLILMRDEIPEESDDEDYKPGPEDFLDQSEEETGPQSVVSNISTSTLDLSASQYLENFDSNLLIDESGNHFDDCLFKVPEENIGQRTRSKLCLSDTPLEEIENTFVPPDITTDMYDFQCDNEDWENFLKEYMQPLLNDTNDPDDDEEADPDYNVMADEEEVDKEELRRDRAVNISRSELRKLMAEVFESPDEYSSDEEEENRVRTEITNRVNSDMRKKAEEEKAFKDAHKEGEKVFKEAHKEKEKPIEDVQITYVTHSQKLLIEQQLRQHIQLTTQHFLQTYHHPLYGNYAKECKIILATLVECVNNNNNSLFNVINLKPAFALVEGWEKYITGNKEGEMIIKHMEAEAKCSIEAKRLSKCHRVQFHPKLMELIVDSDVFLYPLLLPPQGFRCDGPFKVEFARSEDSLISIGLDQFTQYVKKNPRWYYKRKDTLKAAVELLCEYLLVTKLPSQVYRHLRNVKNIPTNPVNYFYEHKEAPRTEHYVVPFDEKGPNAPKDVNYSLLPAIFEDFLKERMQEGEKR